MHLILRSTVLLIFLHQLGGCALTRPAPDKLNSQIDEWLIEHQYDKIEQALGHADASNPDFDNLIKRKPAIYTAKNQYIEQVSQTAQAHKNKNQWQEAINAYTRALDKVDSHPRLKNELNILIKERDQKVQSLKKQLHIKSAYAHLSYDEVYSQLKQLIPEDVSAQRDINRHERNKQVLASSLEGCGERAYREKQYQLAYDCYHASNKLLPSKQKQYWADRIKQQINNQKNSARYSQLMAAYQQAYSKKEYITARSNLQRILHINPQHKQARTLLTDLSREIDAMVNEKISFGKELYSRKNVKDALAIWKQARKYAPNNTELKQLIQRAEKVSKKIQLLEDNQ